MPKTARMIYEKRSIALTVNPWDDTREILVKDTPIRDNPVV
jgi:hypothetical protein